MLLLLLVAVLGVGGTLDPRDPVISIISRGKQIHQSRSRARHYIISFHHSYAKTFHNILKFVTDLLVSLTCVMHCAYVAVVVLQLGVNTR